MTFVPIIFCFYPYLFYYYCTKIHFNPTRFVAYIASGGGSPVSIGHWDVSNKKKWIHINGGGKGC